jgi:TRAP-type C4-dicarboxylate transport system permease small subunit
MVDHDSSHSSASPAVRPRWDAALQRAKTVGDWSGHIAEALGITGLSIGIGLQLWDVLARNLGFGSLDYQWVSDASSLGLIMGALIYVAATRHHIGFAGVAELIRNEALRRRLQAFTKPVVAALLVFLAYYGIELVHTQMQSGGSYSAVFYSPLWLFYAAFPLTCILAAIRSITSDIKGPGEEAEDDNSAEVI